MHFGARYIFTGVIKISARHHFLSVPGTFFFYLWKNVPGTIFYTRCHFLKNIAFSRFLRYKILLERYSKSFGFTEASTGMIEGR